MFRPQMMVMVHLTYFADVLELIYSGLSNCLCFILNNLLDRVVI